MMFSGFKKILSIRFRFNVPGFLGFTNRGRRGKGFSFVSRVSLVRHQFFILDPFRANFWTETVSAQRPGTSTESRGDVNRRKVSRHLSLSQRECSNDALNSTHGLRHGRCPVPEPFKVVENANNGRIRILYSTGSGYGSLNQRTKGHKRDRYYQELG